MKKYLTSKHKAAMSLLLNLGVVTLGMNAPAWSQTYPQAPQIIPATSAAPPGQPAFFPATTTGGMQPTIIPVSTGSTSQLTTSPATPTVAPATTSGMPQPAIIPAVSTGSTSQLTTSPATPAVAPQIPVQPPVVMPSISELVTQWGFTPVNCHPGMASIRAAEKTVCVRPTAQLLPGDYTYDFTTNQIAPVKVNRQYTFTNLLDYGNCLEDILQFYQDNTKFQQIGRRSDCRSDIFQTYATQGISKAQVLEMVEAANFYATSLLTQKLYPPRGQRMRIAQMLGFIYDIDANNQTVRQHAAQAVIGGTTDTNAQAK